MLHLLAAVPVLAVLLFVLLLFSAVGGYVAGLH